MQETLDNTETLAGFFMSRAEWLRIETVDRGNGWWDVAIVIDGTYAPGFFNKADTVKYFQDWFGQALLDAGIPAERLEDWQRPS